MEAWFRPENWAIIQGVQTMGMQFAAAATPPIVAILMNSVGWQKALFWPALPAVIVIALWAWYGRNSPKEHSSVTPAELAELDAGSGEQSPTAILSRRVMQVLANRSIILLTCSYVCMNHVFYLIGNWCFLYLVQERHFNILEGGWLAMIPPLAWRTWCWSSMKGPFGGRPCTWREAPCSRHSGLSCGWASMPGSPFATRL